ncbi:hypothetical protein H310_11597 [Aphanomyces invadans]|uniref:t-SNARE coiled-coil homology domain-containing protein n=1 Tax=Aphanomyces invadans TaxID=157072 RepID=A0A024TLV5_9STRA|nr:hypothetical protein H310_11597 [Aphanomyces invadans]ETV94954.1 hypothetical protein H310_11597 [Aphanomyces invadans]|eukprot:XP_008876545.1 hypothetical protein H310_11597 [Aphanomyces invadans]
MAEIAYYDGDLSDALTKLNQIMAKLAKAPPGIKSEVLVEAEKKLKEVIDLKKGFSLALRQVTDREEIKSYREKNDVYAARVEELTREVKWAKSETDRNGLFGDAKAKASKVPTGNTDLLNKAQELQGKTEVSLKNTQKMIENSKEVALATGETLREQRNQLNAITEEVMRMDDGVARANKLMRTFTRRMATDRLILFFTFLVFAGIVGIIVYSKANPDQNTFYVPDQVKPPDPGVITNATGINSFINNTQNSITGK